MTLRLRGRSRLDGRDLQLGERLTVPLLAAEVLAAPKLENDDLLPTVVGDDLRTDLGALDERLIDHRRFAADEQDFAEREGFAGITRQFLDADLLTFGDPVLLATGS